VLESRHWLDEKIRDVAFAADVFNAKLKLADAILQPVESHINAFREARGHGLVYLCLTNTKLVLLCLLYIQETKIQHRLFVL
jgi:hypothetical protein